MQVTRENPQKTKHNKKTRLQLDLNNIQKQKSVWGRRYYWC